MFKHPEVCDLDRFKAVADATVKQFDGVDMLFSNASIDQRELHEDVFPRRWGTSLT